MTKFPVILLTFTHIWTLTEVIFPRILNSTPHGHVPPVIDDVFVSSLYLRLYTWLTPFLSVRVLTVYYIKLKILIRLIQESKKSLKSIYIIKRIETKV